MGLDFRALKSQWGKAFAAMFDAACDLTSWTLVGTVIRYPERGFEDLGTWCAGVPGLVA